VEQDLETPKQGEDRLIRGISGKLARVLNSSRAVPEGFVKALLRAGRIIVMVDRWGQLSEATKHTLNFTRKEFPAAAFVIASREEPNDPVDIVVEPALLDSSTLAFFLETAVNAALERSGPQLSIDPVTLYEECAKFCALYGSPAPALLAIMYVAGLADPHARLAGLSSKSIPELALRFTYALIPKESRSVEKMAQVKADALSLAYAAVKKDFRARALSQDEACAAVGGAEAGQRLAQLEQIGLIEILGEMNTVRFLLSPVAVQLGALYLIEQSVHPTETWNSFISELASGDRPKSGDLPRAVRDGLTSQPSPTEAQTKAASRLSEWLKGH
jgi:hypothetical protein